MKQIFDDVSIGCSKLTTRKYSTSFSLGIFCLQKQIHDPIYAIYGFVRLADEIVDTFHDFDKPSLFAEFKADTWKAIERGISLNPVLNSFQHTVNKYKVQHQLIELFFTSMEMDMRRNEHSDDTYASYIVGSAEVVGLMCLHVFTNNDMELYSKLEPAARKLGAAFQKVNFLRDLKSDYEYLGRVYFPGVAFQSFSAADKQKIEVDIENDFKEAFVGITQLPRSARFGVYVAYVYYKSLFNKIRSAAPSEIQQQRVRISNPHKIGLLVTSYFRHSFSIF